MSARPGCRKPQNTWRDSNISCCRRVAATPHAGSNVGRVDSRPRVWLKDQGVRQGDHPVPQNSDETAWFWLGVRDDFRNWVMEAAEGLGVRGSNPDILVPWAKTRLGRRRSLSVMLGVLTPTFRRWLLSEGGLVCRAPRIYQAPKRDYRLRDRRRPAGRAGPQADVGSLQRVTVPDGACQRHDASCASQETRAPRLPVASRDIRKGGRR